MWWDSPEFLSTPKRGEFWRIPLHKIVLTRQRSGALLFSASPCGASHAQNSETPPIEQNLTNIRRNSVSCYSSISPVHLANGKMAGQPSLKSAEFEKYGSDTGFAKFSRYQILVQFLTTWQQHLHTCPTNWKCFPTKAHQIIPPEPSAIALTPNQMHPGNSRRPLLGCSVV